MSLVETTAHGPIAEIRMTRPPVNALDPDLCGEVTQALARCVRGGAAGIALTGGPSVFSAGLDVPHLMALGDDREALRRAWEAFFTLARALAGSPVPVAAGLAGHAPAGGCVLALCCDYRVMARSVDGAKPFRIGLNETQVGLVAPEGIQRLLRRVVGARHAERLLVTGAMPTASEALGLGLVDELAEPDEVAGAAVRWVQQLNALPRAPMLATRAIARADVVEALQPCHVDLDRFIDGWYSQHTQEALRAVLAKLGKSG